jgi:hypothetical protein
LLYSCDAWQAFGYYAPLTCAQIVGCAGYGSQTGAAVEQDVYLAHALQHLAAKTF